VTSLSLSLSHLNQLEEEEQAKTKVIKRKEKDESRNKLHNRKQLNKTKRQPTGGEKIFTKDVTYKGVVSKIYNELMKLNSIQGPGDSKGQGSLACGGPWGCKELD